MVYKVKLMALSNTIIRSNRINQIENTLLEIEKQGRVLDIKGFLLDIMEQFNICKKTAQEYIEVAKNRVVTKSIQ